MSEELPEYKLTFIREMEEMRRKQQEQAELTALQQTSNIQPQGQEPAANVQHESWNQSQYSDVHHFSNAGELARSVDSELLPHRAQ